MHRRGAKVVIALGDNAGGQRIDARVSIIPPLLPAQKSLYLQEYSLSRFVASDMRSSNEHLCHDMPHALQMASRIVEAAQVAGASQLVLVSPSGAADRSGFFGFLGGGGGSSSSVEQACDWLRHRAQSCYVPAQGHVICLPCLQLP